MNTKNKTIIAIDIGKQSLQIQSKYQSFAVNNDSKGYAQLLKTITKADQAHIVCEASGGYERPLVRMLHKQQIDVSVVNPAKVRAFAKSEGVQAKTDPIDAKLLLKFAEGKSLRLSSCPGPVREEISELMDRRSQLSEALAKEKNRLEKQPVYLTKWIQKSISFLKKQIDLMDNRIKELIESNAELTKRVKAMTSIKGVGTTTAYTILAYLPELETLSRGQLISLAGLAPFDRESGKTKKKAFIHGGRAKVRKCLYMAAQSAATHNPLIKAYVSNLMNRGKPYKSALVAAMRKLLICMQSLSKNPNFVLE
jgi:transposase